MKDNIININLETSTAPVIAEVRGKDWIEYGDANGEWKNLYPQFLIDLYYSSSISAAIINSTAEMIAGEDLIIEDEEVTDASIKLKNFMNRANSNESLHEVIKKLAFDFKLQGAFALNIVWSKDRTQIAEIYHVDTSKVRCARPDEFGKTTGYYISADWSNTRQNKPYYVPCFNTHDRTSANQLMYSGLYSPNMNSYYTPDYVSCNNWALIDGRVSEFHLNNISNGFAGSFMISFANGVPTQEERFQIEQSLTEKFCSEKNSGKFVLTFSDDKTRTPEITPINSSDLDKQYLALQELLTSNILSGHRVTSKTLMGIDSSNGFSSNTDEIINAANFYLNTVIKPFQDQLVKSLRKIFQVNNMDLPVNFVQLKPITVQFDSKTIREVMTTDEIREELGLEPLDNEDTVEQDVKLKKVCCNKTELQKWINEVGEDMSDDWELVDEEIVDGEHNDFNFEKELNKEANKRIELAETVTARPNARSSQDGVNKSYNDYYKVRYVYETDEFLKNKSGTSREFCELMVAAEKVYRKEDLVNANSQVVNKGFGHPEYAYKDGEKGTYNIFLYKGGPQCRHFFLRKIYKTSLRNAKQPIKDAELIGYTKAVSEGFTAERNDKLVAIPPQRMDNHGYYN
jgi:hypothetical protein